MHVLQIHDPAEFAALATPLLMRDEAENCFWLGLISTPVELAKNMMCVVRDGEVAQNAVGVLHRVPVGLRAHHHGDEGFFSAAGHAPFLP